MPVNPISEPTVCRKCGAKLSSRALEGFCPSCTARLTFNVSKESLFPAGGAAVVLEFGDYELLNEVGRGGMGVIYRARQRSLNRVVALKMILSGRFAGRESVERLRAEATAAAALRHPNIVAIHEIGEVEGQHYFTMDYVEGRSLAEMISDVRFAIYDFKRSASWVKTLAGAIQYAHERCILHRDLKPSNVLIDRDGEPHVTDFGLAKRLDEDSALTLSGQALGSPSFMPPEQAEGNRSALGPASDVYALGALLYHLLTGRAPFMAATLEATLAQVLRSEAVAPHVLNPGVPRDLENVCLKCLEKDPARRYPSARELADELERFLEDQPVRARPVGPAEKLWRWARRNPRVAALTMSLLAVFFAGLAGVLWQWGRAERHASSESQQRVRAENALERMRFQKAEELFKAGDTAGALAHLAHIVENNPANRVATARLLSALTMRNFPWPVGEALRHEGAVRMANFSPEGSKVVTASDDGTARVWDALTSRPLTPPLRHGDLVRGAVFSPDGRSVLTCSHDATARLWDSETGKPLVPPMKHGSRVRRAWFSPDGRRIATASKDASGRIWDARTGALLLEVKHAEYVGAAQFSLDGRWIATASDDFTARVWDAGTGKPVTKPLPHDFHVYDTAFNPQGTRLLTVSHDKTARIWDLPTGAELATIRFAHNAHTARFSPDGHLALVACWDDTARLADAATGQFIGQPLRHRADVTLAEFSPDGWRVLTTSDDRTAGVWSLAKVILSRNAPSGSTEPRMASDAVGDERLLLEPMRHDAPVEWAGFGPDGRRVVTASADHTARIWNSQATPEPSLRLRHQSPVQHAAFSPDGKTVATACGEGAVLWDVNTGRRISEPIRAPSATEVHFSADGRRLALRSPSRTVRLWDSLSGEALDLRDHNTVLSICFSPDGQHLVTSCDDGMARLWDIKTGSVVGVPMSHGSYGIRWARLSPDGRRIVTGDANKTAKVWEAGSGRLLHTLAHLGQVRSAAFSPDNRWVATASDDSTARIWDAASRRPVSPPIKHEAGLNDVQFSPDGHWLATASGDHTARLWEVHTGKPISEALRHEAMVRRVRFSPDGSMIITASADRTARIWDVATGLPLSEPLRHGDEVRHAEFSPDGRRVVTVSLDSTARIWEAPQLDSLTPAPRWLPRLAEALAGQRLSVAHGSEPVSPEELLRIERQIKSAPPHDAYELWAHWFLADRATRPMSPRSIVTAAEYVGGLVAEDRLETLTEAITLSPDDPVVLARLARRILSVRPDPGERDRALADFLARRALTLAPNDPEVLRIRSEITRAPR
jgi:WD40 repeat protein/serine/threonine protein kinase